MTFDANSWKFKKNRKKKMPLKYACISNSSHTETDFFLWGELEIQAYYFIGLLFFFSEYLCIRVNCHFRRFSQDFSSNQIKCCEISNSQMLWEIPLTAFDTLTSALPAIPSQLALPTMKFQLGDCMCFIHHGNSTHQL